mmetsp:Transcript_28155/g.26989  ORF Transcript_28155/g.26989 Transcript_28155/m.26989 type:complete len:92 (-) Transcript_28155:1091-1366(-)
MKHDVILPSVKTRMRDGTIKYGIKVPRTVAKAKQLDQENNDRLWQDAIALEMETILPAFDIYDRVRPPLGFDKSSDHIVFDVKMDFTRKAR